MIKNPTIYEINTRVWIKQFGEDAKLKDVPAEYWQSLKNKGIDFIWLMGIWSTCKSTITKYCFEEGLVKNYKRALKDWKTDDVIGSPYAIDTYTISPKLGTSKDLVNLKVQLNSIGLKLILDYIPNHFSADSILIETHPDIFLYTNEEYYQDDPHTFYKPENNKSNVFAHGRDPFFPAWQDTIQVNYFSLTAREFMINTLMSLTQYCDGIRCDMAMLALNNVFQNTWGGVLSNMGFQKPEDEFWQVAVDLVKNVNPNFIFIGEVYWDLEFTLQKLGFDYTYDKKLTDRIRVGNVADIEDHLKADFEYQHKSVRFIENHDEQRSLTIFGKEKARAAATLISTLQGMKFYYDGQFEGKRTKLPMQLGREPKEPVSECIKSYYDKLLLIVKEEVFKSGSWKLLKPEPSWSDNDTYKNMLAWHWQLGEENRLVVINFSDVTSSCRLKLSVANHPEDIVMSDLLSDEDYIRNRDDLISIGLYIELELFRCHIFAF